ncbi:MAG: BPSS1780 family membrane protein [Azonexus sp.]
MNESTQFPVVRPAFRGESREVDPAACFQWLLEGWTRFIANPGVWIGSTVLLMVILLAITIVPVFGQIAVNLLLPVFAGGMVLMGRRQAIGEQAEIADLFAGFRHNAGSLVMVGVFYTAGIFGIALVAVMLVSGGVLGGVVTGRVAGFGIAMGGMMLAALLVFVLSIPVIMATWFAPALVFLHDMQPIPAMKASFAAGVKNWLPMLVFGLILAVALFFATLPAGLGFLLLVPVFAGAVYASYRDIFLDV